jgi:succinate dehydrogenase/fumarate reductase flavoprotein subunit
MVDPKLAQALAEDALKSRYQLEQWGLKFHQRWLMHHGVPLVALLNRLLQENGVQILEEVMVSDLLVHRGQCAGATGVDFQGNSLVIRAGAVVLATGGDAALYRYNFHPPCVTGDGHAMGYRAGATLANMEFGQIFLCTVPTKAHPHTGLLRIPGARLTNGRNEEFLARHLPEGVTVPDVLQTRGEYNPFTTRDCGKFFDIAITKEILAGRAGPHGGVFLDLTGPDVTRPDNATEDWLNYRGIYPDERPLEMLPARHCAHGGLLIDEQGRSTIPGLYAGGGEVAAGDHGADRLGGHMLASSQVFGSRAGRHAARFARSQGLPDVPSSSIDHRLEALAELRDRKGSVTPRAVKKEIQQRMWEDMLVVRTPEGFQRVLQMVARAREESLPALSVETPMQLVEALEVQNMLTVAEMETRAAEMRGESRGSHSRMDYTERDDANWLRSITIREEDGRMALDTQALDPGWKDRPGDMKHARGG